MASHACVCQQRPAAQRARRAPVHMMAMPTMPVVRLMIASTVASVSAGGTPAAVHCCTTAEAMADRKIRPTSCTWPAPGGGAVEATGCKARRRRSSSMAARRRAGSPAVYAPGHIRAASPHRAALLATTPTLHEPSPTTKRMRLQAVTVSWCRADERTTSLTREPRWLWNQGSCSTAGAGGRREGEGSSTTIEGRAPERAALQAAGGQSVLLFASTLAYGATCSSHPEDDGRKCQLQRQSDCRVYDPSNHRPPMPCQLPLPRCRCRRCRCLSCLQLGR